MSRSATIVWASTSSGCSAAAARAARSLNAAAFARGSDLYFGAGRLDARSAEGQHLLAHEMAHVVQEGAPPQGQPIRTAGITPISSSKPGAAPDLQPAE